MPSWLLTGIEITYTVVLPMVLAYIVKLIKQISHDKKESRKLWEDNIKDLNKKVDEMHTRLDEHISESKTNEVRRRRTEILDFANSCMNKRKHSQEEFEFIIQECDSYEKYCDDNDIRNGIADAAITEIKRIYAECLHEDSFLKEGEV